MGNSGKDCFQASFLLLGRWMKIWKKCAWCTETCRCVFQAYKQRCRAQCRGWRQESKTVLLRVPSPCPDPVTLRVFAHLSLSNCLSLSVSLYPSPSFSSNVPPPISSSQGQLSHVDVRDLPQLCSGCDLVVFLHGTFCGAVNIVSM